MYQTTGKNPERREKYHIIGSADIRARSVLYRNQIEDKIIDGRRRFADLKSPANLMRKRSPSQKDGETQL